MSTDCGLLYAASSTCGRRVDGVWTAWVVRTVDLRCHARGVQLTQDPCMRDARAQPNLRRALSIANALVTVFECVSSAIQQQRKPLPRPANQRPP